MLFLEALNRDLLGADNSLTQALERVEQAATAMEFQGKPRQVAQYEYAETPSVQRSVVEGGTEISIVSRAFVTKHKIPMYDLGSVGFKGLCMRTADGRQVLRSLNLQFWKFIARGL
ncbi:hypothetical protein E4U59_004378 [Claviceps monticola]|nr:hypothetical protein E4U59_004378 [Claviceps monticola]